MPDLQGIKKFLNRNLITVQKPGRYVGGEFNQIVKNWESVELHTALAFPDIYDIGFSNLGISILYDIINNREDSLAERVYSPWLDMEKLLIDNKLPLFSLENKIPLHKFDLIGFSIPYETLYTNVLNMLNLGQIPILATKRVNTDPIIIAGGHATFNPEPMHSFIDAFIIGDGEEVINEILDLLIIGKRHQVERQEIINKMSTIEGVYVPSHFIIEYNKDKTIKNILNHFSPSKNKINKRIIEKHIFPTVNFLVPNIKVVHDRIPIEIMRGCSRGCRFCQAGMVMRPVREVKLCEIISSIRKTINSTGIREISLLSLSTTDYSQIKELIRDVFRLSKVDNIDISLPSLRIESFNNEVINEIKGKRKGNFTIAPEAGTEELRSKINKPISDNAILETVKGICEKGWNNIKLYFMIGFPKETMLDIEGIVDLCEKIHALGKKINKNRFKLHVSINTFIPKSHTPFQWLKFENIDQITKKYDFLINKLKKLGIKIDYPDYEASFIEAILSRGDRRLSQVIYCAWKNGAKFDAWHECFDYSLWENALSESSVDPGFYSYRLRENNENLPWDHINPGINKEFLLLEYERSKKSEISLDCNDRCLDCGIQAHYLINCMAIRSDLN